MDLIYMNPAKEDIGVLKDYTLDMAFGSDENNFECTVSASNNVCESGFYLYAEGTEYGGVIDSINVDTESETITYKGRTWHGILESKVFEPDVGEDYLEVSGEANIVLATLIVRMGLQDMFSVSNASSRIDISYKMNRYVKGYTGILKMLKASGAKLNVIFKNGFVELSAEPFVDYSKDEQFDTDQISFTIEKNFKPVNHVICLGQGDLKDRRVIHLYADGVGNISGTQTFTGIDEVTETYDNSNAESDDELIEGGVEIIKASWASDTIEFAFEADDESFDINDIVGAKEFTTGAEVRASITKKIIQIKDYTTAISYSCESGVGTVASSGYPSSGSGGSSGGTATTVTANVGKTTTGEPGTNASVTNSGTETNVIFDFTIPRGEKGEKGEQGEKGEKGDKGDGGLTESEVKSLVASLVTEAKLAEHPVGSVLMNTTGKNPSTYIGGTWVEWGAGRVPVGVNANDTNFDSVEKTGGANTVTLTESQMPSHKHTHQHTHSISHYHSMSHTHTTPATNISNSGAHTHSTTAKDASGILTVDGTVLKWNNAGAGGSNGEIRSSGTKDIVVKIPSLSIPSSGAHSHTVPAMTTNSISSVNTGTSSATTSGGASDINTANTGGGEAHSNLQPYITCYMWKRTA